MNLNGLPAAFKAPNHLLQQTAGACRLFDVHSSLTAAAKTGACVVYDGSGSGAWAAAGGPNTR